MLSIEADFPNPGARALLIEEHQAHPVRIMQRLGGRGRRTELQISIVGREGSSAVRRVTLGDLTNATPLTEAEEARYKRLEAKLAGKATAAARDLAEFERLRLRAVHHQDLERAEAAARRSRYFPSQRGRG